MTRSERSLGRPSVQGVEPVVPVVLGCHGMAICAVGSGPAWAALPFLLVTALGASGLLGWRSTAARLVRAGACTLVPLVLSVADPQLVPALLQWYYAVAAIYGLVLVGWWPAAVGPLAGLCYVSQVAAGAAPVPYAVAFLRAGVLTSLGLATWTAGVAYRAVAAEAEGRRVSAEEAGRLLEHAATHDELTGLPNRTLLYRRLAHALVVERGSALLLLDLDRFKEVNDTLGHRYGDVLLQLVAARLRAVVAPHDTVARLGGDEFAVLLPGATETSGLATAARLRDALQAPFQVEEAVIAIDASVGVALAPAHAGDGDRLLQLADVAMYDAKSTGTGVALYDAVRERQTADSLALLAELRDAIRLEQLVVEFQPKVVTTTHVPVGMEALVRWDHPQRGRIAPDVFIPLAERSGFIEPLTAYVLDVALEQCRLWRDAGLDLQVSVNLSARNLQQDDLPTAVAGALARHGLPASALELEITESFLMADATRARCLLLALDAAGVRLAIDDFGTGLSSLSYLRDLPVSTVKIDKTFILRMLDEPTDEVIVRGVVDLAGNLGLTTVAEGVEDAETLARLGAMGCTLTQGYFTGRPMPAGAVVAWAGSRLSRLACQPA